MTKYASELITSDIIQLRAKTSYTFEFGKPSGGKIFATIETLRPAPVTTSSGSHVIPTPSRPSTTVKKSKRTRRAITGPTGPGGDGGGTTSTMPIDPLLLNLEMTNSNGKRITKGKTPLTVESVVLTPRELLSVTNLQSWKLVVNNPTASDTAIRIHVQFTGWRPLFEAPYDMELLNHVFDVAFNNTQPISFKLHNVIEDEKDSNGKTVLKNGQPVKVTTSYLDSTVNKDWADQYPNMKISHKFKPGQAFVVGNNNLETKKITLSACVVENKPAVKAKIVISPCSFYPGQMIENFSSWGDSLDTFLPHLTLTETQIEIYFVLRTQLLDLPNPNDFPLPMFDLRVNVFDQQLDPAPIVNGIIEYAIKYYLKNKIKTTLATYARLFLTQLIGYPTYEVQGVSNTQTSLLYAKKGVPTPIISSTTSDAQPKLKPGNLSKIKHIVVVMMENRSFDHMLGYLTLPKTGNNGKTGRGRMDIDGLTGFESNVSDLETQARINLFPYAGTDFDYDLGHNKVAQLLQRGRTYTTINKGYAKIPDGMGLISQQVWEFENQETFYVEKNDGFIQDFINHSLETYGLTKADLEKDATVIGANIKGILGAPMGYHPKEHVPIYDFIAENFAICDKWFCPVPFNTWPNRYVALTGMLNIGPNGKPEKGVPQTQNIVPSHNTTIFDHLSTGNISWKYYESNIGTLRLFAKYTMDRTNIQSFKPAPDLGEAGFFADLKQFAKNDNMPSVMYIDPAMIDISPSDANDDHPPGDIKNGQAFIGSVMKALVDMPQWKDTLFIVTYDEHGGFYDHVYPLDGEVSALCDDDNGNPLTRRGFRVPAFVISPWVPKASVSSVHYDHTTILKTIIARFLPDNPPNMGPRVREAVDLGSLLSLTTPRTIAGNLVPAIKTVVYKNRATFAAGGYYQDKEDFRVVLQNFKTKFIDPNLHSSTAKPKRKPKSAAIKLKGTKSGSRKSLKRSKN